MISKPLPKTFHTALRPRFPIWLIIVIGITGILAVLLAFYFKNETTSLSELCISLGGWIITFCGILLAANQVTRIALADSFSKLHEEEASTPQYHAKRLIYELGRKFRSSKNRYMEAREYLNSLNSEKRNEIHEARRKLKHFWLLAEAYFEAKLMTDTEVFAIAGSPEILLDLEPLEVLATEESGDYKTTQSPWTSLRLLKRWYKLTEQNELESNIGIFIPIDFDLYKRSYSDKQLLL